MAWPKRTFDAEAMDELLDEFGLSRRDLERQAGLRGNRIADLDANGWDPYLWEFWRMSEVLDMDMGELYDAVCPEEG